MTFRREKYEWFSERSEYGEMWQKGAKQLKFLCSLQRRWLIELARKGNSISGLYAWIFLLVIYLDLFFVDKNILYHDLQSRNAAINKINSKRHEAFQPNSRLFPMIYNFSLWVCSFTKFTVSGQECNIPQEEIVCNLCLSFDLTRNPISCKNYIREILREI